MSIEIIFKEESDMNYLTSDTVFDLADCCRTCLGHECSLTPTNSLDSDSIKFCDKLAACVWGMNWAKEGVSSFICGICIEKLRIAYDFQTVCLRSDQTLQLQRKANEILNSRGASPDPPTTTNLVRCNETIGKVILSTKFEETETQILPLVAPVSSATVQLESTQTVDNPCKHSYQLCKKELCENSQTLLGGKSLQCSICFKQFAITAELTAHMGIHAEEKCYVCTVCRRGYLNESDLLAHICSHAGEGSFTCSYCYIKFTSRCMLNSHLKTHTENRNWRCLICKKSYTKSSHLSEHTKTHTGEKYSCKLCDKRFRWSTALSDHMKIHTGNKPWQCNICNISFTQSSYLTQHMKTHTHKFSCELCNERYTRSDFLNAHMKRHTCEKP